MAAKPSGNKSVLVIGLGRFGGSVAATLDQMGQDVLAVDKNPELVARWSAHLPTIQADMTDVLAIEQIDASQFDTAVVAIGDSIEASVIITGNLLDAGVSDLWAKSVSQEHARILQRIGARHIINAETDAGKRVGHLVAGNYLDYIEIDGPYTVVKVHTPLYAVASRPQARSSSTAPRNWSCIATTNSSSWASRIRSTTSSKANPLTALAIPPICSHRDRYNPLNMDALIIVAISHKAVRPY